MTICTIKLSDEPPFVFVLSLSFCMRERGIIKFALLTENNRLLRLETVVYPERSSFVYDKKASQLLSHIVKCWQIENSAFNLKIPDSEKFLFFSHKHFLGKVKEWEW